MPGQPSQPGATSARQSLPQPRRPSADTGAATSSAAEEIASVDRAIAALEEQRGILGDAVVETALAPLRARRAELAAPRAEQRRLVTVVFADLVDFTVLSRQLDAEDTRDVVGAYFARWQQAIEDQGGVVEKFIGDAVMAVFGLSRSFEDDAHRALRAAMQMLAELEVLNRELEPRYGVSLHMRVGVDTGEVVVSTLDERRGMGFVAVGPTVNRASRLQAAAPVDGVLISADTQRQVRGAFGLEARPGLQLKGIDTPVDAFVVLSERRLGFRLDRSAGVEGVETSTVGRELQQRFLQERMWEVTEESRWRVVTVMGDAGVGKSRLLFDFDAWLAERPEVVWWFRGRASPSTQNSANALLRDVVTARLDIAIDETAEAVRAKFVDGFVSALGPDDGPGEATLVGAWLGYDMGPDVADLPTDPQALRDRGTAALGHYFRHLSQELPVVILLEDLHWADEGTLRWIDAVAPALEDARVLVVATSRPTLIETRPRWGEGLDHHERLVLTPLSRRESRQLVAQILQRVEDLPGQLVDLVIDSADGNPFYIEELVTWLIDAGVVVRGEPHWFVVDELVRTVAVPSTLKGVLQSRLDALSLEERTLLQRASVVGRVFWDLAVAHLDDDDPDEASARADLDNLRRRELLLQREVSRFASSREFLFKHALLRDVAYDGVLRAHRERYHRRAAEWLATTSRAAGREDEYAAVIAEHFEQARDPAAASWYLRAGTRAASVYALTEADRLFTSAAGLVPDDDHHLRFDVLAAREVLLDRIGEREEQRRVLDELQALDGHLDLPRRVLLLLALGRWEFVHSDYEQSVRYAAAAGELATTIGREDLRAEATLWQGKGQTWADDIEGARASLSDAVARAREAGRPLVVGEGLRYLSMVASNAGEYAPSLDYGNEAREVFARTGDAEMESTALAQLATTYFNMGRYAESQAALEETLPIFRRSGHRYREAMNLGNLASVALMRGHLASSERWAREALESLEELDEIDAGATYALVLGQIESQTSRLDDARAHLEKALHVAREMASPTLAAETLVQLVYLTLAAGDQDGALAWAREAVAAGHEVSSDLGRGYTLQSLGYATLALGSWTEAAVAFDEAGTLFEHLERDALVRECRVGRAAALSGQGEHDAAVALVGPVLEHLDQTGLSGAAQPGLQLLGCHRVLLDAGDARAATVIDRAGAYLRAMAEEIGDETLAAGYLASPPHPDLLGS